MDGEDNGKPYWNGWFGGKTHYFWETPIYTRRFKSWPLKCPNVGGHLTFEGVMFLTIPKRAQRRIARYMCIIQHINFGEVGWWMGCKPLSFVGLFVCLLVCLLDCFGLLWDVFSGCPLKIIEIGKRCLPKNGQWQQVKCKWIAWTIGFHY